MGHFFSVLNAKMEESPSGGKDERWSGMGLPALSPTWGRKNPSPKTAKKTASYAESGFFDQNWTGSKQGTLSETYFTKFSDPVRGVGGWVTLEGVKSAGKCLEKSAGWLSGSPLQGRDGVPTAEAEVTPWPQPSGSPHPLVVWNFGKLPLLVGDATAWLPSPRYSTKCLVNFQKILPSKYLRKGKRGQGC